ncbi:MAG: hypothetical protein GKR90_25210 [Pseudomonadales bacterium]|nr:hypothetical protein [Pseudomonadales bacterium]
MSNQVHNRALPSDVRETDAISARLKPANSSADFIPVRVWRISPFGIEIVKPDQQRLESGQSVQLQVIVEGRRTEFEAMVISHEEVVSNTIVGIRFFISDESADTSQEKRRHARWVCAEEFLPRAIAASPGRYNEFIGFTVRNVSREGLQLTTSIQNVFLIPGMTLALTVNLPMVGDAIITIQIIRLKINTFGAEEILDVGAEITQISSDAKKKLGQYLLQFSDRATLRALKENDFLPEDVSLSIRFTASKSEKDYREILSLRKNPSETGAEETTDSRDNSSRLLLGRVGSVPVFTSRVGYPSMGDMIQADEVCNWDHGTIRRDEIIEVASIYTDSDEEYFGDVILGAFRYICTSCTNSNRHNILVVAKSPLVPYLTSYGWRELGSNETHSVLLANAYDAIKGKSMSPLLWNFVWRDVADYLIQAKVIEPVGLERVMLSVYRLFGPLTSLVFSSRARKMRRLGVVQKKK